MWTAYANHISTSGSICNHELQIFASARVGVLLLHAFSVGFWCGLLVGRVGHPTATGPHPLHQNRSSCALTLVLSKMQLRVISTGSNEEKR